MTLSDNSKKRLAQGAAGVGAGAGVTGLAMLPFTLLAIQACSMPFNAGHELEKLKEIWSPGNTIGDFNISAVSLLLCGWLVFSLAMQYLESNEKDKAETKPQEIPLMNLAGSH
jgi:hypothetical protein